MNWLKLLLVATSIAGCDAQADVRSGDASDAGTVKVDDNCAHHVPYSSTCYNGATLAVYGLVAVCVCPNQPPPNYVR